MISFEWDYCFATYTAILPFMQDTTMAVQSKTCKVVWPMICMYVGIGSLEADKLPLYSFLRKRHKVLP